MRNDDDRDEKDTWQSLADCLGVLRQTVGKWKEDTRYMDTAPKGKSLVEWQRFMKLHGLIARHADIINSETPKTIAEWKIEREKITCATLELKLRLAEGKLMVASQLELAVGQLLAGVATALAHFSGANARFLVGIKDPHTMQERLDDAINSVLLRIHAADYMHAEQIAKACEEIEDDREREKAEELVTRAVRRIGATAIELAMREQKAQDEGGNEVAAAQEEDGE